MTSTPLHATRPAPRIRRAARQGGVAPPWATSGRAREAWNLLGARVYVDSHHPLVLMCHVHCARALYHLACIDLLGCKPTTSNKEKEIGRELILTVLSTTANEKTRVLPLRRDGARWDGGPSCHRGTRCGWLTRASPEPSIASCYARPVGSRRSHVRPTQRASAPAYRALATHMPSQLSASEGPSV